MLSRGSVDTPDYEIIAKEKEGAGAKCGWVTSMFTRYGSVKITQKNELQFVIDNETEREFASHIELF